MKNTLVSLAFAAAAALCAQPASAHSLHSLETGLAVTDANVLRELELRGLGIGAFVNAGKSTSVISNGSLAAVPSYQPVQASLLKELETYRASNPGVGVGTKFGKRLFDPEYLSSGLARFVLVGVVNRMDRAYRDRASCGEIRMIYRLAYRVQSNGEDVFSRLPMTINVVLRARPVDGGISCEEIASRWLKAPTGPSAAQVATELVSAQGALSPQLRPQSSVDRIEINMQIVRWPAAVRPDFGGHAEYLFKVYAWNQASAKFSEATLENQIDRERLAGDPALLAKLKRFLFLPENVEKLDRGTIEIPEEFLARRAISTAPGGVARSSNRPFFQLMTEGDLKSVAAQAPGLRLQNIQSAVGANRRLNDITCTGCHQTRAIGGFHFMGRDPLLKYPGNSVFVPASAHFFGELPRRRDIVESIAAGRANVDFSRGFSSRPQGHRPQAAALEGTGLLDGWGAHCAQTDDPSFKTWTCAPGLQCKGIHKSKLEPGVGICVPADGRREIGDALEAGLVTSEGFGRDKYTRQETMALPDPKIHVGSPQSATAGQKTGGFPGGNVRRIDCKNLPKEAVCGALPAARGGFNSCVGQGKNFVQCIKEFAAGVGLRGCDTLNPCRDDYICSESYETGRGACVPPYFLFQFRVDGHPIGKAN